MRLTDEQIGAELTELRPTPNDAFATRLDRRVAAGFPSGSRTESGDRELTWGRLLPALGALAAVAVVVVVINNNSGPRLASNHSATTSAPAQATAPTGRDLQGQSSAQVASPAPVPRASRPRNGRTPLQEQTASLGLATDAGKLQDTADGVAQVTDRYDGFVDSSTVHVGGAHGHASFALRIPTAHLNDAMSDLSDLGHVTSSDTGSTNVTGSYVDAAKAYRDAQAKVASLLDELRNASSPTEAASIKRKIVVARQQLAATREALRGIKQHVALTPVNVQITAQGDGNWSIGDASDDAVSVLEAIGGALLIALAVLVPLAALSVAVWLGARELHRRQREAPLDR
jgi:uncharacterized protein DUF4349